MLETQREKTPRDDNGEWDTALAFLDFVRGCVLKKVEGLDEAQLRRRFVVSDTTLLGIVQHLTAGEHWWFGHHLIGDERYSDVDFSMVVDEARTAEDVIAAYRAAIAESDANLRGIGDPDALTAGTVDGERKTVRWVLAHTTSEISRHAGHADILRELLDGTTGR